MTVVAAVQMTSGPDVEANLREAGRLLDEAAGRDARLVVLPENFAQMGLQETDKLAVAEAEGRGPVQEFLSRQAADHGFWLVGGTIALRAGDGRRVRSACLLYDDQGRLAARYDKIHLFDVQLPGGQESYLESATVEPGDRVVVADTPFGRLGLAVCYDLRFPELFRRMLDQGMEITALPAAFTAVTGQAHWQPLLRARAIENLCHVIASAQGGVHANGRQTHGHSMIIDPWGTILDLREQGTGVAAAELDPAQPAAVRRLFPAIAHRRLSSPLQ